MTLAVERNIKQQINLNLQSVNVKNTIKLIDKTTVLRDDREKFVDLSTLSWSDTILKICKSLS